MLLSFQFPDGSFLFVAIISRVFLREEAHLRLTIQWQRLFVDRKGGASCCYVVARREWNSITATPWNTNEWNHFESVVTMGLMNSTIRDHRTENTT